MEAEQNGGIEQSTELENPELILEEFEQLHEQVMPLLRARQLAGVNDRDITSYLDARFEEAKIDENPEEMATVADAAREMFDTEDEPTRLYYEVFERRLRVMEMLVDGVYEKRMPWLFISCWQGKKGGMVQRFSTNFGGHASGMGKAAGVNKIEVVFDKEDEDKIVGFDVELTGDVETMKYVGGEMDKN